MPEENNIWYFGEEKGFSTASQLQAGPISLQYANGSLRYLKSGREEVLRMIYFAVRDHNWDTIEGEIMDERIEADDRGFRINFISAHKKGPIDISFECSVNGDPSGRIEFLIDGEAASSFRRNRIGFCVLHPVKECIGKPCLIEHENGVISEKKFPEWISPHQPFRDIRSMEWEVRPGFKARVSFEGDVFESEDQRNWTDASYKTYCTPLGIPFPVTVKRGDKIRQKVILEAEGPETAEKGMHQEKKTVFRLEEDLGFPLPGLGFGSSSTYGHPDGQTIRLIRDLAPDHIRWDLQMNSDNLPEKLQQIGNGLHEMGTNACLALFFGDDPAGEYDRFLKGISGWQDRIKYLILFSENSKTTPESLMIAVSGLIRRDLPGALIGGGTNAYFTELNRERIEQKYVDFIVYSVNPQVHAFDNESLTETLEAQYHTVKSTRLFSPGKEIMISPVTLKPRFNPNATGPELPPAPGELPSQVDVRQMSLYGACWTLGSIKYLSESGVNRITYYETAGWRGVLQGPEDPPEPEIFRARKGDVFPVYGVFAWLRKIRDASLINSSSSDPLIIDGLAARQGNTIHVYLANFSMNVRPVNITDHQGPFVQRTLSVDNVRRFMNDPFGENGIPDRDVTEILLPPCSISHISFPASTP